MEGGWLGEASPRAPGRAPTSVPCVQVSASPWRLLKANNCGKYVYDQSPCKHRIIDLNIPLTSIMPYGIKTCAYCDRHEANVTIVA